MCRKRLVFLLVIISSPLAAQTISGLVVADADESPIPAAMVIIAQEGSDLKDTVRTDAAGKWVASLSPAMVVADGPVPDTPQLWANYPNPFNPVTMISFYLPQAQQIRLRVYNTLGQVVAYKEGFLAAGCYRIAYHAQGPAGVYFYSLHTEKQRFDRKMLQLEGGQKGGFEEFMVATYPFHPPLQLKSSAVPIVITIDKFAYWPDTLRQVVFGGEFFYTRLKTVHDHAVVVDLHNDVLELMINNPDYHLKERHTQWHTDIPRLRRGGVDVQFFVLWPDPGQFGTCPFQTAMKLVDIMKREEADNPDDLLQVTTANKALSAVANGKIAYIFGVEGGHAIENDLNKLYQLYHAGMRYLTITWNNSTSWAVSAADSRTLTVGLSDFGIKVIRALDSLGVLIDVSHVGIKTIADILAITHHPVIASHSGARALRDHYRNLYDDQIRAIAEKGGVIGVVFYPPFLVRNQPAYLADVVAHIDHIVKVAGIDHVALGSDFDGFSGAGPVGLEDTSKFPNLTLALLQHGYSPAEVEKILGGNVLRLLHLVCGDDQQKLLQPIAQVDW